jgi:hypothetical protein
VISPPINGKYGDHAISVEYVINMSPDFSS